MTLLLSMFARDGIYQSSDHRLSSDNDPVNDDAVKHLFVARHDGAALVGFTGQAVTRWNRPLDDWIRRTFLQSESPETIEGLCLWLRDRLNRDRPTTIGGEEQPVVIIFAAQTTKGRRYFRITNIRAVVRETRQIFLRPLFEANCDDVTTYRTYPEGSGSAYATDQEVDLCNRVSVSGGRSTEDIQRLLARVTERISKRATRVGDMTVGSRSFTLYMPNEIWPVRGRAWHAESSAHSRRLRPVPIIIGKHDATNEVWRLVSQQSPSGNPAGMRFVIGPVTTLEGGPDRDSLRRTNRSQRRDRRL